MLFLHELHEVAGRRERDFEAALRDGWVPALAGGDDARLLYFAHHAHGTGASYRVVTLTAVRDGAAWQRLQDRVAGGDLRKLSERLDDLRHDVTGRLLVPLPWSPLQQLELARVPPRAEHEPTVFMEDTVWPHEGRLEEYVERSGKHYAAESRAHEQSGKGLLQVQAGFRSAFGGGRRREIVLWQKLLRPELLSALVSREVPEELTAPGTWMHDALEIRDRWESRLLRTSRWSPWS